MVLFVTKCDAKIESYNATMDYRIKQQVIGILKGPGFERMVLRDGEILVDKTPLLPHPGRQNRKKKMRVWGRVIGYGEIEEIGFASTTKN